jgi:hypothetical protein
MNSGPILNRRSRTILPPQWHTFSPPLTGCWLKKSEIVLGPGFCADDHKFGPMAVSARQPKTCAIGKDNLDTDQLRNGQHERVHC